MYWVTTSYLKYLTSTWYLVLNQLRTTATEGPGEWLDGKDIDKNILYNVYKKDFYIILS